MTTQGCLPKSCRSLNLEMENFASHPQWPVLADSVEKVGFLRVSRKGVLIDCRGFAEAGR
jgi:hypothetical protein